ncbi:MAG: gas vesicle protein [Pseudomonadota bacterium]
MSESGNGPRIFTPEDVLSSGDTRLLDVIDGLLDHGVVLRGELWISVAEVDLVYLGLNAVLTTPDKIRPPA